MTSGRLSPVAPLLVLLVAVLLTSPVRAEHRFLTLGGGYNPEGNQLSLERNVLYLQRVLKALGIAESSHEIYFSDGTDPGRDLQVEAGDDDGGELRRTLARVVGPARGIDYRYRSHEIPGVKGAASLASVDRWFNNSGWRLKDDDRLTLYFTGHGGKSRQKNSQNTTLYLWAGDQVTVRDFAHRLDKLPSNVPVVLVMVQCYSGGFANVIFEDGDPTRDLAEHNRCGFFATVHDRSAAGCTARVDEAEYREYSSYFWAALAGFDRLGQAVEKVDFDGDGSTSLLEAHAYSLIHCDSIDICIKTSDAFLRRFSATKPPTGAKKNTAADKPGAAALLTANSPMRTLLAAATPIDRAVIERLSERLGVSGDDRAKAARQRSDTATARRAKADAEFKKLQRDYAAARRAIADELKLRWPELSSPWHPQLPKLLEHDGPTILRTVERHRDYPRLLKTARQMGTLEEQMEEADIEAAKCQRLIRVLENVALEANLPSLATPQVQARYAELIRRESATLK